MAGVVQLVGTWLWCEILWWKKSFGLGWSPSAWKCPSLNCCETVVVLALTVRCVSPELVLLRRELWGLGCLVIRLLEHWAALCKDLGSGLRTSGCLHWPASFRENLGNWLFEHYEHYVHSCINMRLFDALPIALAGLYIWHLPTVWLQRSIVHGYLDSNHPMVWIAICNLGSVSFPVPGVAALGRFN